MRIKDMFEVGIIMESEDKSDKIKILGGDDCEITGKILNRKKIILHMKRLIDGSEGNVFVRLKDEFDTQFDVFKKLFSSRKVVGLSLNGFKDFKIADL